jgi:NodT family efflux transporter outer membrane factor (OMF) lipoprotein
LTRYRKTAAIAALATALAACATLPHPGARPAPAAINAFATSASFSAPPGSWPSDLWWRNYQDPQLTALIEEGLAHAPDFKVAAERFARAEAVARQFAGRQAPQLDANGQIGAMKQSYNYIFPAFAVPRGWKDFDQTTVDLSWEVDFWGKTRAASRAAHDDAAAAEAEAADARLVLSAGIASAYADLAQLYAELDAARDAVAVRRQTADLLRGRLVKGLENNGAVERAQSGLASAEADQAELTETIDLTRTRIALLLGEGPDRGLAIGRPAPRLAGTFGVPRNLPLELVGRRPDVIAARARAQAAASRIRAAKAAFYPDVNLSAQIGLQALGVGNLVKSGSDYGTVAPAVSLPLFDGGQLAGQYRAAEADYRIAVAQYDGALAEALSQVADAVISEKALATRLDRTRAAEGSAAAAWRTAQNRYRGGLATYLDVLTAEDSLINARRAVASLETRAFALDISLVRALGGGFQS